MADRDEALRRLGAIRCPRCGNVFDDTTGTHPVTGLPRGRYGVETRVVSETREMWMSRRQRLPGDLISIRAGYGGPPPPVHSDWTLHATCSPECARAYLWTMRREHDAPGAEYRLVMPDG